ncbi:hypothetical protein MKW92_005711, partial [Papaver armeniacum]
MKNKFINHARNVWDRAVSWLSRIDQLWYTYGGDTWDLSYIKVELRYNDIDRARNIFARFVECHPRVSAYIRYVKFEMKNGEIYRARNVYVIAVDKLIDNEESKQLFVAFAEFEEKCKETEHAPYIYKFALDHILKGRAENLYRKFVADEDAIMGKRRFQYEEEVKKNPYNYDSWFDYIRLEENAGRKNRIREIYERAIANVPPAKRSRCWQSGIYTCGMINYALYEELDVEDMDRKREIYRYICSFMFGCLKLIPPKKFSFAKYVLWLHNSRYSYTAKKSLPTTHCYLYLFSMRFEQDPIQAYINFEISEREYANTTVLYEKLLISTTHYKVWERYAKFEAFTPMDDEDEQDGEEE